MYKLEKNTDLDFILQKEVQQICFGIYQVIVNFNPPLHIAFANRAKLTFGNTEYNWKDNDRDSLLNFPIQLLIGKVISNYEVLENNNLKITFDSNCFLLLIDENSSFESYTISSGDDYIVI